MSVEVTPVVTKSDQKIFLNLPWKLYKNDANWIPPIRKNQKELCGYLKHPFYDNAESQGFVARKNGEVVGRILAIANHQHNQYNNDKIGFFGFFESDDDSEVAKSLFDAANSYLQGKNLTSMRGPVNPSMNYECGLLIDGFDSPPVFMMTYNKSYYQGLIEQNGFAKSQDLYAYMGTIEMLAKNEKRWKFIHERLGERMNIKMRSMLRKDFDAELRGFLGVYNRALIGSWGFVPITEAEMDHMADGMRHLIAPEMTGVVEVDGERVGVTFGMLDYNPRIKQIDGKLFPFGFIRLLANKRKIKRIRLISTNVVPEFQKNKGIGLSLFCSIIPNIREWGIEECEFSWVLESNRLSRATLERCGTNLYKSYRMFDREID